jgi:hypothetical protein
VFNWGRATLGTIPFVWLGARNSAPQGVLAGQAAGAVIRPRGDRRGAAHRRTGSRPSRAPAPERGRRVAPPIPPFSSGKAATALDWADPEEK